MAGIARFRLFVAAMTRLADSGAGAPGFLAEARPRLRDLVAVDDWLPEGFDRAPDPPGFGQRLLYCDPAERFSVVCFAWGSGTRTPVHDHRAWGLVGQLRGEEISREMIPGAPGTPMQPGRVDRLRAGEVMAIGPGLPGQYDIHCVEKGLPGSVCIHVYGSNVGAKPRAVFDPATSTATEFVSGYDNAFVPNLWFGQAA